MISPYQAFPLTKNTISGVLADQSLENMERILHANADTDVTLTFPDTSTVTMTIAAGMDIVLDGGADTVTTTAAVTLS
jgi:hypothetical protein